MHRLEPGEPRWLVSLAHRLIDTGNIDEARLVIEAIAREGVPGPEPLDADAEIAWLRARVFDQEGNNAGVLGIARERDPRAGVGSGDATRAAGWLMLAGRAAFRTNDYAAAEAYYRRALAIKPGHDVWASLAATLPHLGRIKEAIDACHRALRFDPRSLLALQNLGWVQSLDGDFAGELATLAWREALGDDPAGSRMSIGMGRLRLGDFAGGWADYDARLTATGLTIVPKEFADVPRWTGIEPLAGRRLLVYGEQGIGDNIMMMRYFPLLKAAGATILYVCQPEIHSIVAPSLGVDELHSRNQPPPIDRCDLWVPVMSLPRAFGTTLTTIPQPGPYLQAPPDEFAYWREKVASPARALRIGLAWAGNPSHKADRLRSIPFDRIVPLLRVPKVQFHSVQLQRAPEAAPEARMIAEYGDDSSRSPIPRRCSQISIS